MLYFAVITVLLLIFYLLTSEAKASVSDNEIDYNNIEVVQETAKYEKVRKRNRWVWNLCAKSLNPLLFCRQ